MNLPVRGQTLVPWTPYARWLMSHCLKQQTYLPLPAKYSEMIRVTGGYTVYGPTTSQNRVRPSPVPSRYKTRHVTPNYMQEIPIVSPWLMNVHGVLDPELGLMGVLPGSGSPTGY